MEPKDSHSYSNPSEIAVTHLSWQASVSFGKRILYCTARWTLMHIRPTDSLILDTKDLLVKSVLADGKKADFEPGKRDPILGSELAIKIQPGTQWIEIEYETTPGAEALQWLEPDQTAGKRLPFLFTQSQAILARSWIPCQDSPGVRFTYDAKVQVPQGMLALMSASNPTETNEHAAYSFVMNQPVPSYLMALCVGDLTFRPVGDRCGIYSEPTVLDAACHEFADLERMVLTAESLYGPYLWERYDLLVLPPSFPFGGMENPRLTFVTPSIIAGDRSLTSLIAHELAHSWSGNLVTNATWNDFWLNEGFTVYFETRIMEQLYGIDYGEMLALLNLEDLKKEIDTLTSKGKAADTRLRLDLTGRSPDEGVTEIAYNKGYFFLRTLEETYGRRRFDQFVRDYFANHAFQSLDTDGFKTYLIAYYKSSFGVKLDPAMIDRWIEQEGLPPECFVPQTHLFDQVKAILREWTQQGALPREPVDWNTQQWLFFLGQLPPVLDSRQMLALDGFGKFSQRNNAELFTQWALQCIRNEYHQIYPRLREFLMITGRRKFILPLYEELMKSEKGKTFACEVYAQARPNYHFVATNSLDPVLNGSK